MDASRSADDEFKSWDDAVVLSSPKLLPKLVSDCEACCKSRLTASEEDGSYSGGDTQWLAATAAPRCLLEQLVMAIFRHHVACSPRFVQEMDLEDGSSGAEWWTLAIDPEDEVGLHWDKDYSLESAGVNATPEFATVTYLSDLGAPTLILARPCPPAVSDPIDDGVPTPRAYLSFPAAGKHVRFDGALLHGAPSLDLPTPTELRCNVKHPKGKRRRRVSLLVNIWLAHKPSLAAPLPPMLAAKLSPCLSSVPFGLHTPSPRLVVSNPTQACERRRGGGTPAEDAVPVAKQEFSWPITQCAGGGSAAFYARLPLASIAAHAHSHPGASLQLHFGYSDALCVEDAPASTSNQRDDL